MTFQHYILQQAQLHPAMTAQDAVKLCYQGCFGPGHLIADPEKAAAYLHRELVTAPFTGEPMVQPISPDYCRISLPGWREAGLPEEWLTTMFLISAAQTPQDGQEQFFSCLASVEQLALQGLLPFSPASWRAFLENYGAPHAVHHSEAYREAEAPAYRVVSRGCADLIPLLTALHGINKACPVIAIDGRAASGKSTAAELLSRITGGSLIHMDDFFLPMELRTELRLSEPGGNIHYERFSAEVLPHLGKPEEFSYGIFHCGVMAVTGVREIPESALHIVEGSYSHHPIFGAYADLTVFCDVPAEIQMQRILQRDGEVFAKRFAEQWVPMEEQYFRHFAIRENAQFHLTPGTKEDSYA